MKEPHSPAEPHPATRSDPVQAMALVADLLRENKPVLDRSVLEELRQFSDQEQDLVQELVTIFLADSPMQLLALQDALRDSNWAEVERRSHRLKGSAGSIGATRLREICEQLERYARQGKVASPEAAATVVTHELEALKRELECL